MGAWGPGVFSDDLGCEVRDQYRQLISQGQEGPVATDALLESFRVVLLDEDSTAVFWLALAVTQWRVGRLEDRVKNRAIAVIENTTALWAWQNDAAALAARRKVLANVLTLLHSPQRAKTVLRKPFKNSCEWESGELIAFQLRSRQYVIFRVIGHWTDNGGTAPVMEILDWCGTAIPEAAALHNAPIRSYVIDVPAALQPWVGPRVSQFLIGEVSKRRIPWERIRRLHIRLPPTQQVGGFACWLWRSVDEHIESEFGYR